MSRYLNLDAQYDSNMNNVVFSFSFIHAWYKLSNKR